MVNLAGQGIKTIWYNLMPLLHWTRTDLAAPVARGGSCLRFEATRMAAFEIHKRQNDVVRAHCDSIGERLMRDLDALMALPPTLYYACEKASTRATSILMVRYRGNDYSAPVAFAYHEVQTTLRLATQPSHRHQ